MNRSLHYHGFIDACIGCGLKNEAADALYKKAGIAGRITGGLLGRGSRALRTAKVLTHKELRNLGRSIGVVADKSRKYVTTQANRIGTAIGNSYKDFSTDLASSFAAKGGRMPKFPKTKKLLSGMGEVVTSPMASSYRFITKHPVISTVGGVGLGAYLGNPTDLDDKNSVERMRMRTLTPSEKIMYERNANGLGLPGLGLDPMYFTGQNPNSMLQYLRY